MLTSDWINDLWPLTTGFNNWQAKLTSCFDPILLYLLDAFGSPSYLYNEKKSSRFGRRWSIRFFKSFKEAKICSKTLILFFWILILYWCPEIPFDQWLIINMTKRMILVIIFILQKQEGLWYWTIVKSEKSNF